MTESEMEEGRRYAESKHFEWRPGMRVWRRSESSGLIQFSRLTESYPAPNIEFRWAPDTTDDAFKGLALGMVRRAWRAPLAAALVTTRLPPGEPQPLPHVSPLLPGGRMWICYIPGPDGETVASFRGRTETAALLAALRGAP